jgi:hypothetical protein
MYNLVPPKSKLIEYKSVHLTDKNSPTFMIKIFDFDEDNKFASLIFNHITTKDGKPVSVSDVSIDDMSKGEQKVDNDSYYCEIVKMGVEIPDSDGKEVVLSWAIIRELANKVIECNNVVELEK